MHKIKDMSETSFLKLFFVCFSLAFVVGAFFMPDSADMFNGLREILFNPIKQPCNSFVIGGFAGTFLSVGLVGIAFTILAYLIPGVTLNGVSTLGFILTVGFAFWGINIINIWPTTIGCVLYCIVKKEPLNKCFNAMMFCTGVTPILTEFLLRYPNHEIKVTLIGLLIFMASGIVVGFFMPAGLGHAPNVHKGFDLYSAAVHVGFSASLLYGFFYITLGVPVPDSVGSDMSVQNVFSTNMFCGVLFGMCILVALLAGCRPKDYLAMIKDSVHVSDVAAKYGNHVFLMNVGVYGLCILACYNMIEAQFNAPIVGVVFCMLCTCNSGSHPGNVWPVLYGYVIGVLVFPGISYALGGEFVATIDSQSIAIGLCFANGLSPICSKYSRMWLTVASLIHYCLVTTIPSLYGGMCLYNGGLTAAFACLIVIPQLERFCKVKEAYR